MVRGDCEDGIRPCPRIGCRYHLLFEVNGIGALQATARRKVRGRRKTEHKPSSRTVEDWIGGAVDLVCTSSQPTCALDVAAAGEHTMEEVGILMGMTREMVRVHEQAAMAKIVEAAGHGGEVALWLEMFTGEPQPLGYGPSPSDPEALVG